MKEENTFIFCLNDQELNTIAPTPPTKVNQIRSYIGELKKRN